MGNEIREIFSYGLEEKNAIEEIKERRLYLNDDVGSDAIDYIVYNILKYNRDDAGKPIEERKPIILYINTNGGELTAGLSVIDAILQSGTPVYTVNVGTCYSAGFLIFLSGKKRYAMEHSTFLCHDGWSAAIDSVAKLKDRIEFETTQIEGKIRDFTIKMSNISTETYDDMYRKEWYMFPDEAKAHGIVDYIVGVDCELDEIL